MTYNCTHLSFQHLFKLSSWHPEDWVEKVCHLVALCCYCTSLWNQSLCTAQNKSSLCSIQMIVFLFFCQLFVLALCFRDVCKYFFSSFLYIMSVKYLIKKRTHQDGITGRLFLVKWSYTAILSKLDQMYSNKCIHAYFLTVGSIFLLSSFYPRDFFLF